jgi:hypothetical protein
MRFPGMLPPPPPPLTPLRATLIDADGKRGDGESGSKSSSPGSKPLACICNLMDCGGTPTSSMRKKGASAGSSLQDTAEEEGLLADGRRGSKP